MRKVERKAVESTITQATSRIEATVPQPGSVAVESSESTRVDSVGAVCDGGTAQRAGGLAEVRRVDSVGAVCDGGTATLRHERLQEIARKIASLIQRLAKVAKAGLEAKVELGLSLIEARDLCCKRGEWTSLLKRHGLKPRTAEECIQFAKYRDLLEENAHGRAPLTTEEARKSIAAHRRAIGHSPQRRAASRSNRESIGERERGLEIGDQGQPDQPGSDTTDAPDHEPVAVHSGPPAAEALDPAATATPLQPAGKDRSRAEVTDPDEPAASTTVAARSESGRDAGQQQAPAPSELSEEEWLAAIPLRDKIQDKRHFDEEATLWRRLQPALAPIRKQLAASPQEVKKAAYLNPHKHRLRVRLLFAILIISPHEWRLCDECVGRCTDRTGKLQCTRCDGWGFFIEHEGNERIESGGAEDPSAGTTI
jgi:hypothetical protein